MVPYHCMEGQTLNCSVDGVHCALCEKLGYFGPVFPSGQGDHGNHCVSRHKTAPDSYSVQKTQIMG